ncbi:MAG: bifunctional folylpolyglutamate synthase/dihydrofolate synthase [Deltaproteobacteria bacterium]|nr:bifunctional folylpolyglutamate synthase/dihydrofolate synthase [Deltaproteobacteria bacterium]
MLSYQQTLDHVYRLEVERMDLKLERVAAALQLCGSPQLRYPALHVAGTNGKGSTATFLYAMLTAAGYRAGLFTSPHLVDFRERIRLGDTWISEQEVIDGVAAIRAEIEPAGIKLTPFEMMTVLAFRAFAQASVDVAVVEVGLGGRLDATNVLTPLVAVITSIGLDHQAYLGNTIAEIAREKGGIIKSHVPTVIGRMEAESREVLCSIARERESTAYLLGENFTVAQQRDGSGHYIGLRWQLHDLHLGLRGQFQHNNAATALAALELAHQTFPINETQVRQGLLSARWPGRIEIVSRQPLVILDGAHNSQAMQTLVAELPALLQGRRVKLLFAVMRDKDWRVMIPLLAPLITEAVVTRVQQSRAEDPALLRDAFAPFCPVHIVDNAQAACRHLLASTPSDEAVLIAGSLFLVGEVYPLFAPTAMKPLLEREQGATA